MKPCARQCYAALLRNLKVNEYRENRGLPFGRDGGNRKKRDRAVVTVVGGQWLGHGAAAEEDGRRPGTDGRAEATFVDGAAIAARCGKMQGGVVAVAPQKSDTVSSWKKPQKGPGGAAMAAYPWVDTKHQTALLVLPIVID